MPFDRLRINFGAEVRRSDSHRRELDYDQVRLMLAIEAFGRIVVPNQAPLLLTHVPCSAGIAHDI